MALVMNDILTLAKAGFNATQIAAFAQISQAPTTQVPPVTQVPAAPPVTQVPPVTPVTQVPPVTQTDPVLAEIQKLTGVIQANALLAGNMPTTQQTADDVLASIINPPTAEKK